MHMCECMVKQLNVRKYGSIVVVFQRTNLRIYATDIARVLSSEMHSNAMYLGVYIAKLFTCDTI